MKKCVTPITNNRAAIAPIVRKNKQKNTIPSTILKIIFKIVLIVSLPTFILCLYFSYSFSPFYN